MLQNPCKTLGFKKNMVYKIPPGGEVNHIQPVAYSQEVDICIKVIMMRVNIKLLNLLLYCFHYILNHPCNVKIDYISF